MTNVRTSPDEDGQVRLTHEPAGKRSNVAGRAMDAR